ncbi:MAG: peptide chain release factor 2 [Rhodospirillales bacterium]|nr:peptide chain release factor 2 [Rhodospirillales bacterium]MDP6646069.1 peptide chain release factor 2 [Rhodospirillales bacterium]MDP6841178.1 peptide chain release factor 2 [Rhodospirillales bacterium]
MRAEIETLVSSIKQSLELLRRRLDYDAAVRKLDELNALAEDPKLWDDPGNAQSVMRQRNRLENGIRAVDDVERDLTDNMELIELGDAESDQGVVDEAEAALRLLAGQVDKARLQALLSGEVDGNDCYLEIHAGAGGTEAQDWAQILERMYARWAEKRGYKIEWLEESAGEEAGIKSCVVKVCGEDSYGWLKTESGVHRLVRISPFDASSRRHTSFASVWVYPVIDDNIEIEIEEKDLRVDTYRASGAGGQHVNKTDSAVRITHLPTGIVVQCQNDRSQHRNRAAAYSMLRARLYEAELQKREVEAQAEHDSKTEIGWGHQIRSYVLQPYQMVKDLRTGAETSNTQAVLDGELDEFMAAMLASRIEDGETAS